MTYGIALPLIVGMMLGFLPMSELYSQENSLEHQLCEFLRTHMEFSSNECQKIIQGELIVKTVRSGHKSEVLVVGVGQINIPKSYFIKHYGKGIKPIEIQSNIQSGLFSNPPQISDLENYRIHDKDLVALRECEIGGCNIKIDKQMIERFQQEIDWDARDHQEEVNILFRKMMIKYLNSYLKEGNEAMMVYRDKNYTLSLVTEFQALLKASPYLDVNPAFYQYLKNFPRDTLSNVRDLYFWMKEDFGLNYPVLSLNHLSFYQPADPGRVALLINKQLYANHYFEASLAITAFVGEERSGEEGFYIVHVHRFRIDALRRGGLLSGRIRRGLQNGMKAMLKKRMINVIETASELHQQRR